MTTMAPETQQPTEAPHCGCCGRALDLSRLTELESTPGVFICTTCALWAARRSSRVPVVRLDPRLAARWVRNHISRGAVPATMAIPVLYSADLGRTAVYYEPLGLKVAELRDTYLVVRGGSVELHFSNSPSTTAAPGEAFLHVADAGKLWKQLQSRSMTGLGPVEDHPNGMREFVITDPDGNRIRFTSRTPKE
jgi:glyoxalase/bleomycin resistance protein/dioxygenase superfamily protein